jgi:hypothetical protein
MAAAVLVVHAGGAEAQPRTTSATTGTTTPAAGESRGPSSGPVATAATTPSPPADAPAVQPAPADGSGDGGVPTPDAAAAEVADAAPADMTLNPGQPEFTVVNLPTTLRVPKHRFAFRVTHRFTRDLTEGGFDDLLADFFGFDGGAQIGLELRYGVMQGWQVGLYRTSDRTIQFFTQYNVLKQGDKLPFTVDALATIEGSNNFNEDDELQPTGEGQRSPALGTVVSHVFGRTASINATLAWVNNTNNLPSELVDHNDTVILGIGGHLRVRPTVYLVAEVTPRIGGNDPGKTLMSFAVEKRVGGHAFQVNFSNGFGSTIAQIARGGVNDQWFIGFNITRKFF